MGGDTDDCEYLEMEVGNRPSYELEVIEEDDNASLAEARYHDPSVIDQQHDDNKEKDEENPQDDHPKAFVNEAVDPLISEESASREDDDVDDDDVKSRTTTVLDTKETGADMSLENDLDSVILL